MGISDTAKKLVDELFVNGFGQEADRLVLTTAEGKDLGGWCKKAVLDRVEEALQHELLARRKADRFSNNQNHCGGYNAGCDGDLVGMPHEKGCPARKLDMELRPHLYMPAPPEVSNG